MEHLCVGNSSLERSGFLALVDSGTSFTYLPPEIYDKVVLEVHLFVLIVIEIIVFIVIWPEIIVPFVSV